LQSVVLHLDSHRRSLEFSTAAAAPDLVAVIITEAVVHGGPQFHAFAQATHANPPTPGHKLAAVAGLTFARERTLVLEK